MKSPAIWRGNPLQGKLGGSGKPPSIPDPASSQLPDIADPYCREAVRDAIWAMRNAARAEPSSDYAIFLALRNGGAAIESFNDRAAEDLLVDTAIDLIDWLKPELAMAIIHQGGFAASHARWEETMRKKQDRSEVVRSPYYLAESTVAAFDWVLKQRSNELLDKFLEGRPQEEIKALRAYLRRKQRQEA